MVEAARRFPGVGLSLRVACQHQSVDGGQEYPGEWVPGRVGTRASGRAFEAECARRVGDTPPAGVAECG